MGRVHAKKHTSCVAQRLYASIAIAMRGVETDAKFEHGSNAGPKAAEQVAAPPKTNQFANRGSEQLQKFEETLNANPETAELIAAPLENE